MGGLGGDRHRGPGGGHRAARGVRRVAHAGPAHGRRRRPLAPVARPAGDQAPLPAVVRRTPARGTSLVDGETSWTGPRPVAELRRGQVVSRVSVNDRSRPTASTVPPPRNTADITTATGSETRPFSRSEEVLSAAMVTMYCWMDSSRLPDSRLPSTPSQINT